LSLFLSLCCYYRYQLRYISVTRHSATKSPAIVGHINYIKRREKYALTSYLQVRKLRFKNLHSTSLRVKRPEWII
jgi:hypothetical protein